MNWQNVDLNSTSEREQNILDPLSFDILLLEISCNIKTENLNAVEIEKHFLNTLKSKVEEAKEIFKDNLQNIVKQSIKERNKK